MFIGVINEFIEFSGYYYFGASWPGMFSPMDLPLTILNNYYIDTIHDLFTDLIGAIIGAYIGYLYHKSGIKSI